VYRPFYSYKSIPDYTQQTIKQFVWLFSSTLYIWWTVLCYHIVQCMM